MIQAYQSRCRQRKDKILGSMIIITKKDSSANSSSSEDVSRLGDTKTKNCRWFRLNKEPEIAFSRTDACFDVKKSPSEIEIGERVEILEGDHMHKTGLVLGVLDNIVQVVIDGREKKSRFFRSGSVRTCRTTVASTQQDTSKTGQDAQPSRTSDTEEERAEQRTNAGASSLLDQSFSKEDSGHSKRALYQQSSLIDQLENRSLVKLRVNNLLEDLVEDENRPPVKYVTFERPKQSLIPAHLEQSMSSGSTLTAPSIRTSQHTAHEASCPNNHQKDHGQDLQRFGASARLDRIPNEPSGRTLDPPIIDVTTKVLKPRSPEEHVMVYRRKPAKTHRFLIGGTVQISDGVHKGRNARVTKLSDGLVQVQVGGSQAQVLLSPGLLRSLPDPPSSLHQLWHGSL